MPCEWCGCDANGANHATSAECVEALKREVAILRLELARREGLTGTPMEPATGPRSVKR